MWRYGFLVLFFAVIQCSKLNVPRVLLPFSDEGSSFFTLFSNDGCFQWKATRPEVLVIQPVEEKGKDCTSKAIIAPNPNLKTWTRTQTVIMAEDEAGSILRCDVIIDVIKSLQIVTKTHELYLEEPPEEFSVRAYDVEGNEFSTLSNLVFKWHIIEKSNKSGNKIRFIKFRDNPYAIEKEMEAIEAQGKQGSKVLLEGIKTGSVKVSVMLTAPSYRDKVPSATTWLVVVTNLFLVPQSALVMMGASITYTAEQMKGNQLHRLTLSSPDFSLQIENAEIGRIQQLTVVGLAEGSTVVSLMDHNTESFKPPTSNLRVGVPDYIVITLPPHHNTKIMMGNEYDIVIEIFDSEHQKFHPSDNIVMEVAVVEEEFFTILSSTKNNTAHIGRPNKIGACTIKATLLGVIDDLNGKLISLETPLDAKIQLEIYEQIRLEPKLSVFPWDPTGYEGYSVQYQISGYKVSSLSWSSSNSSVSTISQAGNAITQELPGISFISASMKQAVHNKGTAEIRVLPVIGIRILKDRLIETEIDKELLIPVTFFWMNHDKSDVELHFTDCTSLRYQSNLSNPSIFEIKEHNQKGIDSCVVLTLIGLAPGYTKLTVSYGSLSDEIMIAAYKPLISIQPSSKETLLVVDSSTQVIWTGGPIPFIDYPDNYFREITLSTSKLISWTEVVDNGVKSGEFVYEVLCHHVGSTKVTLSVGNKKSHDDNRVTDPVIASSSVTIICGQPDRIKLEALTTFKGPKCPLMAKLAFLNYKNLDLLVSVLDSSGKRFDNSSTLQISVKLSNSSLGYLKDVEHNLKTLVPKGLSGELTVTALLKKPSSSGIFGSSDISDQITLRLVFAATFSSPSVTVFNQLNDRHLEIKHGSGYFEFSMTDNGDTVFDTKYFPQQRTVKIMPSNVGEGLLIGRDLCLPTDDFTARVYVTGLYRVELVMPNKVMLGEAVEAQVRLFDERDQLITDIELITLTASSSDEIVSITSSKTLYFTVRGSSLGITDVTVKAVSADSTVKFSAPQTIQVFPPLRLDPKNVTMLIGAEFQVSWSGGPSGGSAQVLFYIDGKTVATTDQRGLIKATSLGETRLVAKVIDRGEEGVVYGRDECRVRVIPLSFVKIHAPIAQLSVGNKMPLTAITSADLFSIGTVKPELTFLWSISDDNSNSAELETVFRGRNAGAIRLVGIEHGMVRVRLEVRHSHQSSLLFDEIEIKIVDDLRLLNPPMGRCPSTVLMTVNSNYQLKTNRNNDDVIRYDVISCDKRDLIRISPNTGLITAGDSTGSCVLRVSQRSSGASVSVVVEIRPVEYMMINANIGDVDDAPSPVLRGLFVDLDVSYHDRTGRRFDSVDFSGNSVQWRPSRFDAVTFSDMKLEMVANEFVVLHGYYDGKMSHLHDFIPLDIRQGLVGDLEEFRVGDIKSITDVKDIKGVLSVEPEGNVIFIEEDGQVPMIQFIEPGPCKLMYVFRDESRLVANVQVLSISRIEFEKSSLDIPLTDAVPIRKIPIKGPKTHESRVDLPYFHFTCHVDDVEKRFYASPWFEDGIYYCVFTFKDSPTSKEDVDKEVVISVKSVSDNVSGDEATLPFYRKFSVLSGQVIKIDNLKPATSVSISGSRRVLSDLEVDVSDSKYLELGRAYYEDNLDSKVYPVYLRSSFWTSSSEDPDFKDLSVTVTSILTSQSVRIPVKIVFRGDQCSSLELGWSSLALFLFNHYQSLLFTAIICIIFAKLMMQQQQQLRKSSVKSQPLKVASPSNSSILGSPMRNAENRPYLWTVDNSPVYGSPTRSPPRSLTQKYMEF